MATSLLFLALLLLAAAALLDFLDTLLLLSLEVALGGLATLLELLVALLGNLSAEVAELGNETAQTVLEGNGLGVLLLGLAQFLGDVLLVKLSVELLLGIVIGGNVLEFLATEGTLQVVDTLSSGADTVVQLVLLLLKLSQLHGTQAVGIKLVKVDLTDVNTLNTSLELLKLLLELLLANAVLLILNTLELTVTLLIGQTLLLGILELLGTDTLAGLLLALLALQSIGSGFLLLVDKNATGEGVLVLLGDTSNGAGLGSLLGLKTSLAVGGIDVHAGDVESLGETGDLEAGDFGGGVLQTLDGANLALSGASAAAGVGSLGGREDIGVESQDTGDVINANSEVTLLATVHDELLDHGGGDLEGSGELGKLVDELELNGLVNLGQLLEETGENDLLQRHNVLLHLGIVTNLLQDGGNLLADGQRVEVNLEDVVQLADLGAHTAEQTLVESIAEEHITGGRGSHTEKVSETGVLVLASLIHIDQSAARAGSADNGDGQSGEKDEGGGLGHLGLGDGRVLLLGALAAGQGHGRKTEQVVVAVVGGGVEEVVLANKENAGELLVVVGHHNVLGGALAEVQQGVDILNAAESLLPQLQLNGNVQLLEASVEVALQGVGVAQVDGVHLGRVLGGILDVVAQELTQAAELSLAGVLLAELEGLEGSRLIHDLETGIVLQDLEDGAVSLPQELEPRGDNGAVGTVARLLTGDSSKEDGLGGLDGLQILNVRGRSGGLEGRLDLIGLGLSLGDLLFGELDELLENNLQR